MELIQPLLPSQIAERADIGQREAEPILVLVAHRSQRKAAVLQAQPAAIPVVAGLGGCELQIPWLASKPKVAAALRPRLLS